MCGVEGESRDRAKPALNHAKKNLQREVLEGGLFFCISQPQIEPQEMVMEMFLHSAWSSSAPVTAKGSRYRDPQPGSCTYLVSKVVKPI